MGFRFGDWDRYYYNYVLCTKCTYVCVRVFFLLWTPTETEYFWQCKTPFRFIHTLRNTWTWMRCEYLSTDYTYITYTFIHTLYTALYIQKVKYSVIVIHQTLHRLQLQPTSRTDNTQFIVPKAYSFLQNRDTFYISIFNFKLSKWQRFFFYLFWMSDVLSQSQSLPLKYPHHTCVCQILHILLV